MGFSPNAAEVLQSHWWLRGLGELQLWRAQNKICLGGILDLKQSLSPGALAFWTVGIALRILREDGQLGIASFSWREAGNGANEFEAKMEKNKLWN